MKKNISFLLLLFYQVCFSQSSTDTGLNKLRSMAYVPGTGDSVFFMGDVFNEGKKDEVPLRRVRLNGFYMDKYEVTFLEFDMFCDSLKLPKPNDWKRPRGLHPVGEIDWYLCIEFANWRSKQMGLTPYYIIDKERKTGLNSSYDNKQYTIGLNKEANGYRLPTEAEWEYAARECGKKVRFGNGENMARFNEMTFNGDRRFHPDPPVSYSLSDSFHNQTRPVGKTKPNSLGIYDLSGNIEEWCWDWYAEQNIATEGNNPDGPAVGKLKVYRGGSFRSLAEQCRVSNRSFYNPNAGFWTHGFRLVRSK